MLSCPEAGLTVTLLLLHVVLQTDLTHPLAQVDLAASSLFLFDVWMNFRTAFVGEWFVSSTMHT